MAKISYSPWRSHRLSLSTLIYYYCISSSIVTKVSCFSLKRNNERGSSSVIARCNTSTLSAKNEIVCSSSTKRSYQFSIPLINPRPKPKNIADKFVELWNDPRPISSLLANNDRSYVGSITRSEEKISSSRNETSYDSLFQNDSSNKNIKRSTDIIPYCIISDEFEVESHKFQILLYPRGRFVSSIVNNDDNVISGPASAYLRYIPKEYGDEVDVAWKLQLVDTRTSKPLPVLTSGGLPLSNDTWSAAMTFCTELEAIESVGRATDWGSSTWFANDICNALGHIAAVGEITIFGNRTGETSFGFPLASKGGLGAVIKANADSSSENPRDFRVGEVIVPISVKGESTVLQDKLRSSFIYSGVDYRIMTMTDKDGNAIFSTSSLPIDQRQYAKLALRPCGWKLQQQLWQKDGMRQEWPVEIEAGLLASNSLTRFNLGSAIPRITSAFRRDWLAYTVALLIAITPIPFALLGRNLVSLYVIPSSSMEPTLMKGDVLLVEKLPGIVDRTSKGDIILFKPPESLKSIIQANGGSPISGSSLFVKRIVGFPGDSNIEMNEAKEVTINGELSVGPDRNLCDDEPLRLIDRLLVNGRGKFLSQLAENEYYVLGDCKAVSVDSRVFGVLPKENIVGKPIIRVWPTERMSAGPF